MKKIKLIGAKSRGRYSIVDDCDYERVSKYKWHYNNGYAVNSFGYRMHRLIMMPPDNMVIDHINHDRLDNRRENLRICTQFENSQNRTHLYATCGNVYSNKNTTRWFAQNMIDGKKVHSKIYNSKEEAEKDLAAMQLGIIPEGARVF